MSKACIDCSRRHIGCHDHCKDYLEYKNTNDMVKEKKNENYEYKEYLTNKLWKEGRA